MPRVSEFYGIAIYPYYSDHNPPHFHAVYDPARIVGRVLVTMASPRSPR